MITEKKYRILVWLVVILFAMNLATVGSLVYHARKTKAVSPAGTEQKSAEGSGVAESAAKAEQGASFFRERLDLTHEQMNLFREANQDYNRKTNRIARDLDLLRVDMVREMTGPQPDTLRLNGINRTIGERHEELKRLTAEFYLRMREVCNENQKEKLNAIFMEMVQREGDEPVQQGRRMRWGRQRGD